VRRKGLVRVIPSIFSGIRLGIRRGRCLASLDWLVLPRFSLRLLCSLRLMLGLGRLIPLQHWTFNLSVWKGFFSTGVQFGAILQETERPLFPGRYCHNVGFCFSSGRIFQNFRLNTNVKIKKQNRKK
jgi:hypothetical protein